MGEVAAGFREQVVAGHGAAHHVHHGDGVDGRQDDAWSPAGRRTVHPRGPPRRRRRPSLSPGAGRRGGRRRRPAPGARRRVGRAGGAQCARAWSSPASCTSELAHRAGILVSSASQHLTVLRRAGLVVSRREAREADVVFHAVTRWERTCCGDGNRP
ncbi:ArsR/SmtB family transcription factor, partial [Streptomyces sp. SAS_260]|uniref:ArsR/SmtB family transcription factor n=1 Tax=Streptomyces sp. SAS_260 TaxID=3412751 RepID=UPI00403C76C1